MDLLLHFSYGFYIGVQLAVRYAQISVVGADLLVEQEVGAFVGTVAAKCTVLHGQRVGPLDSAVIHQIPDIPFLHERKVVACLAGTCMDHSPSEAIGGLLLLTQCSRDRKAFDGKLKQTVEFMPHAHLPVVLEPLQHTD